MLIWGSVGILARKAGLDPLITVTFRVLFATIALAALRLLRADRKAVLAGNRFLALCSGVALATNWLFFFQAVQFTSVSHAVLSYYVAPILVAMASPLLLRERLEGRTLVAMALACAGIFVMLYQPGHALQPRDLAGIGYGLLAACFYATVTITGRRLSGVPPIYLVFVQCSVATLILLPVVLITKGAGALAAPPGSLLLLAVVGVVHTALALFLYFWGLQRVKVQHVGVLAYLDPVSAVLFALLFLGEVPAATSLMGGALVLGGSALLLRR